MGEFLHFRFESPKGQGHRAIEGRLFPVAFRYGNFEKTVELIGTFEKELKGRVFVFEGGFGEHAIILAKLEDTIWQNAREIAMQNIVGATGNLFSPTVTVGGSIYMGDEYAQEHQYRALVGMWTPDAPIIAIAEFRDRFEGWAILCLSRDDTIDEYFAGYRHCEHGGPTRIVAFVFGDDHREFGRRVKTIDVQCEIIQTPLRNLDGTMFVRLDFPERMKLELKYIAEQSDSYSHDRCK